VSLSFRALASDLLKGSQAMDIGQSEGDEESEAETVFTNKRPPTLPGFSVKENVKVCAHTISGLLFV